MKGKEYVRPVGAKIWLRNRYVFLFMLREMTAAFIAAYAIFLLVLVHRAQQGPEAFSAFIEGLKSPVSIVLHLIALAMALYHSLTWFVLGARAKALWRGEEQVSPVLLAASQYVAWAVVSVLVAWVTIAVSRG